MKELIREYWLWILIPCLVIALLVTFVVSQANKTGSSDSPPEFGYDI